jgi:histone H2A
MAGGKGKSIGGKGSGAKDSAAKSQKSHSAKAGLQVSHFLRFFTSRMHRSGADQRRHISSFSPFLSARRVVIRC